MVKMHTSKLGGRALKHRVFELLKSTDLDLALGQLCRLPARQVINPLLSFLHNGEPRIKWSAVTAMGAVVAGLANEDIEAARVIMRRLMWNLNDESGGIGWGSPEVMGEILACHETLAREYARILISYARKDGNFQEHELMQRGVLWGIGRLAQARPDLAKNAGPYLMPYLESPDATVRGVAAWIIGLLGVGEARPGLEQLKEDDSELQVYIGRRLLRRRVNRLAEEALKRLP